jgi:hypothetical protein
METDLTFFRQHADMLIPNYHVQKMFSVNHGYVYFGIIISRNDAESTLAASGVQESKTCAHNNTPDTWMTL